MAEYDANDLKSTLIYIKNRFGIEVFSQTGKVAAILSDLAPKLKKDRGMLERISRMGILDELLKAREQNETTKKYLLSKVLTRLVEDEYIRIEIATQYVNVIVSVLEWNIELDASEASAEILEDKVKNSVLPKRSFNRQRYQQESQQESYLLADKARWNSRCDEARMLYSFAYREGNILAGVMLGEMYFRGEGCDKNYEKALVFFKEGREKGNPLAAGWIAEAYRMGKGVEKDKEEGRKIYEVWKDALIEMCDCGCKEAQYFYGSDMLYGFFESKDIMQGVYWLKKAMDGGDIRAGICIAECYLEGWGYTKDVDRAIELLKKYMYCSVTGRAEYQLAKIYYYGEYGKMDSKIALEFFQKAAGKGYVLAKSYIGNMYYYGDGVKVNYVEARKWYELAGIEGVATANKQLGFIYWFGKGVQENTDAAFNYFKLAADQGSAEAQYQLWVFYILDERYQDISTGKKYLEKAAESGYMEAQKQLAQLYLDGTFGMKDEKKFFEWILKAAEQDDPEAEYVASGCYQFEVGTTFNKEKVAEWMKKALVHDYIPAIIKMADFYLEGRYVERDEKKGRQLLTQAELKIYDLKKKSGGYQGIFGDDKVGRLERAMGKLYLAHFNVKSGVKRAFEHFCKAFYAGDDESLYDMGWLYFVNNCKSVYLKHTTAELLVLIQERAEKDKEPHLAYLLGTIYHKGYKVLTNEKEAIYWYQIAVAKGSTKAEERLKELVI